MLNNGPLGVAWIFFGQRLLFRPRPSVAKVEFDSETGTKASVRTSGKVVCVEDSGVQASTAVVTGVTCLRASNAPPVASANQAWASAPATNTEPGGYALISYLDRIVRPGE
jgi:hypothetical protein